MTRLHERFCYYTTSHSEKTLFCSSKVSDSIKSCSTASKNFVIFWSRQSKLYKCFEVLLRNKKMV